MNRLPLNIHKFDSSSDVVYYHVKNNIIYRSYLVRSEWSFDWYSIYDVPPDPNISNGEFLGWYDPETGLIYDAAGLLDKSLRYEYSRHYYAVLNINGLKVNGNPITQIKINGQLMKEAKLNGEIIYANNYTGV